MKKSIAILLAFTLITAVFWVTNPITTSYAQEYRNGFMLTPVSSDASGINVDTDFILKTKDSYSQEQIIEMLRLLGDIQIEVTQNNEKEFLVKVKNDLEENSLYTFILTTTENKTVSWTFQTQRDFTILGTLPAHQSNYIPVNSGIEIYFSHKDFGDVDKYFQISPHVAGRFESNGYTAVFIPKRLEPGTIYTITIKKGLPLNDTKQKLEKDYVFAFETAPEDIKEVEYKGSLSFGYSMIEFSSKDAPLLPINIYSADRSIKQAVVSTSIYKFNSSENFIDAVKSTYERPYWAYASIEDGLIDTKSLLEVVSFDQTFDMTQWQERYLSAPEALQKGFYIVESTYNGLTAQALVQITDISAYFTQSDTQTLFWVNNIRTGKPVQGAKVTINDESKTYTTNEAGVVTFETIVDEPDEMGVNKLNYFTINKVTDELILINNRYRTYREDYDSQNSYWRYFQTDRSLYKPDDQVQFWGYLKDRTDAPAPEDITVEIAQGNYWGMPGARMLQYFLPSIQKPLVFTKVSTDSGFFEGSFNLPQLSPGGYQITIKSGENIINSHYISVENYVKPAYKMTVEKDKNAIFLDESVNFIVTPAFFDGTPLPFLDVSNNLRGNPFESRNETVNTGASGKIIIPFTATTDDSTAQGERRVHLNATASLPESGMISGREDVRVFINDINATFTSNTDKSGKTTLGAKLNKINLDKINDPETDDDYSTDFLGDPVTFKKLSGTIIYHYYEKIEDGEEYDYINKVVRKRYRYEERTKKIQGFSFKTDETGLGSQTFDLKDPTTGYYTAELIWHDGNGRIMTREVYLSSHNYIGMGDEYDWYHLESDKDKYRTGDEVTVTLKNNEKDADAKSVLFIEAQNGITDYKVQNSAEYKTSFDADKVPNFYVTAVYFNGNSYVKAGSRNIRYDTDEKKIDIEMKADREAYRPGDIVTINITAVDENKNPIPARINLALMDEAMLEISNYYVDVLGSLYQWLNSGLGYSHSTHQMGSNYSVKDDAVAGAGGRDFGNAATPEPEMAKSDMAVSFDGAATANTAAMSEVQVRSDFRDTALFKTIVLDEYGTGTLSFKLPDNVTSWHVTLAGISSDLYGGTDEASLKVTLPFFINDSMNTTYLKYDFPYIGVSSYGNDLTEGEIVNYQITCDQNPEFIQTVQGKAFERTNIPLWELDLGVYDIDIKAISESGLSDGIRRTIQVLNTYHEIETAVADTLKVNMGLTGGKTGLTTLIFTDEGRGKLLPALYNLAYSGGSRLDQKYVSYKANELLDKISPDRTKPFEVIDVELSQYQRDDGGYGILPYSESDVELSALLSTILKDEAGSERLKQYFYSLIFAEPGRVSAPALYGLAVMGEPVLLDLKEAAGVSNLTFKDKIYLALAFDTIGETIMAQSIYDTEVVPVLEDKKPYIRVNNSDDTDMILKETALAAVLASKLDAPHKEGLYQYIT
ncbi:MAG TPA: alpha-2-macroglobulin family protein, partial [Thermoclostridium sp.]|nr:alpha-2-macroglobulin family protein [Thermoclostridium sp.]